jgi:hypothetical protein
MPLTLYYSGMATLDKNSSILLSLLRALSGLDKNFPLPCAIFCSKSPGTRVVR